MQQPFDLELNGILYAIFPEGEDIFVVFKEGKEYLTIQKDTDMQWIKLDSETGIPTFESDEEVNNIGRAIAAYVPEEEDETDIDDDDDQIN